MYTHSDVLRRLTQLLFSLVSLLGDTITPHAVLIYPRLVLCDLLNRIPKHERVIKSQCRDTTHEWLWHDVR